MDKKVKRSKKASPENEARALIERCKHLKRVETEVCTLVSTYKFSEGLDARFWHNRREDVLTFLKLIFLDTRGEVLKKLNAIEGTRREV
ncbi:hypothetical protein J6Z39_09085 [bacterium]|nr:hypothetical protein [bacterium]MBP5435957.1 hypothetical protein [bacterium]